MTSFARSLRTVIGVSALSLVVAAGTTLAQETKPDPVKPQTPPVEKTPDVKALPVKGQEEFKKTQEPPLPVPSGPAGEITFEKLKTEFGAISDEQEQDTTFVFTNTGKGTLQMQQPKGSCGCTVPNLDKLVYEPGERGEIKVRFNPKGKPAGKAHTTVTVTTNDPAHQSVVLDIEADVRPIFRADPMMIAAGQAQRGQVIAQKLSVLSRKPDLAVMQATSNSPRLLTKVLPPQQVTENGETLTKTEIEISVAEGAIAGPLNENITVRTSDPNRFITVYVTGEIMGLIQPSPVQLNIPMLTMGQQISSTVRLSPRAGKAFKVTGIIDQPTSGVAGQIFKFDTREDTTTTPSTWLVIGTGAAPAQPGRISGEWVISTDLPDEPTMRIRYTGFVKQQQNQAQQDPAWQQNPSALSPAGG